MNYCRFCGTKLHRPQSHFCPRCGEQLIFEERTETHALPRREIPDMPTLLAEHSIQEHTEHTVIPIPSHATPEILAAKMQQPGSVQQEERHGVQVVDVSHGPVVKHYKLVKPIGDGNMSEVYFAEDMKHKNKMVAVKLLNTSHKDAIKQEMYLRETRALEQLEHPNIITHLDYGWSAERQCHYIVLEYLPRTLVDEIVAHRESSDLDWCWPLMRDMTDALVHAHSKGIIHRDLKSTNILLTEAGIAKLTDFGISLLRFDMRRGVTLSGFYSEGFASPEQRSMQTATEQSDIYSLGCIFYHMLSGEEPPAGGPTLQDIQALPVHFLIKQMFERMLDAEAKNRFESTEQLARFLEHTHRFQTYPDVYFTVTREVTRKLFNASLINKMEQEDACWYLEQQFIQDKQDKFPKEVQIKLEKNDRYALFTDAIKFVCIKDENAPVLVIIDIEMYLYPPTYEEQRKRAIAYRRRWHFLRHSKTFPAEQRDQLQQTLEVLTRDLTARKQEELAQRAQKRERKDFTRVWSKILDLQQRMLNNQRLLEYERWHREGNTITFYLKDSVPDDLGWPDSAPIAFQSSGQRMESIGLFMGANGKAVEVSTTQGGTLEQSSSPRKLPKLGGRIGLFQIETISALQRQKQALEMLIAGGTVNTRLPDVLQDLSTAEFAPLDESIVFSQPLGEDQKCAVRQALATRDVFLLQGPPGTGKTTTLAEIIVQILREQPNARILVSSQSNVAVNHVLTHVAKKMGGVGLLRIGRAERIGSGAEEWTIEKQQSIWRDSVLSRTDVVIHDLKEKIREQQVQLPLMHGKLTDAQLEDLRVYKTSLEELVGYIEDFSEHERRIARLEERLDAANALSEEEIQAMSNELAEHQRNGNTRREYIAEVLGVVRRGLPESVPRGFFQTSFSAERARLYQLITTLLDPGAAASAEEKLLALVRDWQSVFGKLDDFADHLYEQARILAATCLIAGTRRLREIEFDWAIIDEAGRATATELLIPMVRSRRSIIVGDERQLPPMLDTELREEALKQLGLQREELEKSLFETLVAQGQRQEGEDEQEDELSDSSILPAVQMLKEQYRMHPAIGEMISQVFYNGQLTHATTPQERAHNLPWLATAIVWYSTTKLPDRRENQRPNSSSFSNQTEVNVILTLLERMENSYREIGEQREVAIITPYNEQILLLRQRIQPARHTRWMALSIEIATVDAFQGRDSHIVIYSAVRSNKQRELGFLKDRRRLNVALSRAQQLLIMVGDIGMLGSARAKNGNPYQFLIRHMHNNPDDCLIEDVQQGSLHE